MLSDLQKHISSIKQTKLIGIDNEMTYTDGLISGVQAVRVATKEHGDTLTVLDVAFKFSGEFNGNNFVFSTFDALQFDVSDFTRTHPVGGFQDVQYELSPIETAEAKLIISNHIKENLAGLFNKRSRDKEATIITKKSAKLADGVKPKQNNIRNMSVTGIVPHGIPDAVFTVNGKDIGILYQLRFQLEPTQYKFNKELKITSYPSNKISLERFVTDFLETAPIDFDEDEDSIDNYAYKPNDPDFTYEQKLSIVNYLVYEGFKYVMKAVPDNVVGVYGE